DPVQRIWAGERDVATLTANIDGNSARLVRRILELVAAAQTKAEVLASLPAPVRAAFDLEGEEFSAALRAALAELPAEEAEAVVQRLRDADLISSGADDADNAPASDDFEPLLQAIAAAVTDTEQRPEIEAFLVQLAEKGWRLHAPVLRIWAGERDATALTAGLDEQDSALVQRILALLAAPVA
ncbi:MAG: hypothetical protein DYG89_36840, partial [Caldilinea sp. CFX5]|nr:hypothetical protein [Caldilinea sp. CFX5]